MKKLGVIIQARLQSTRLPRKILTSISGSHTILSFLLDRLILELNDRFQIIIATTLNPADDELVDLLECNYKSVLIYRGDEYNVLERFIDCAESFHFTHILRICSDNPLLDLGFMKRLINATFKHPGYDYYSFFYKQRPVIKTHFGIFCEIVATEALKKVKKYYPTDMNREHVTIGVYQNDDFFSLHRYDLTAELLNYEKIRLTIDTIDDLNNIREIIQQKKIDNIYPEVFDYVLSHPLMLKKMENQIIKQSK